MPRKKTLKWPSDYIDDAPVSIARESFEKDVRRHLGPSRKTLALFQGSESAQLFTWLFKIACIFQKENGGISAMKQARIHAKLASFYATIESNLDQDSIEFQQLLQKWSSSGHPWERDYAQTLLSQPHELRQSFTNDWLRDNRFQRKLAAMSNRKRLKQEFIANLDIHLRLLLQRKTIGGRPLGENKQQRFINSLIAAVMLAAGESWTSRYSRRHEKARLRQQRSRSLIQRRPGPEEMIEEEVGDYVQIGQKYVQRRTDKQQKSSSPHPATKKRSRSGKR